MSDKPTIVLVHGFWGGAAHWSKVIVDLSSKGYTKLRAVEMPLTSSSRARCCWLDIRTAARSSLKQAT
jgi:pimeloyl-ACP methyl ester carboxylesterase